MKLKISCSLILGVTLSLAQNVIATDHLRRLQGNGGGNKNGNGNGNSGTTTTTDDSDSNTTGNGGNNKEDGPGNSGQGWGGLGSRVYDCEVGCGLDEAGHGPPVCGTDGITYFNECLAVCQDIEVVRPGNCPGQPAIKPNDESYVRKGRISKANMDAFKKEKLKFTGARKLNRALVPPPEEPTTDTATGPEEIPDELPEEVRVKRITRDGYEYSATIPFSELPVVTETKPTDGVLGPNPAPHGTSSETLTELGRSGGSGGRKLTILGDDTRSEVTAWDVPNWRLGELEYAKGGGGCSGAIVGSNAVLTAAHCVFQFYSGEWMVPEKFAPGRHRSGETFWDPWGHWWVNYATMFTPYFNSGSADYDIAVLKIGSGSAHTSPIGDYMGTLGMKVQPCEGSYVPTGMRITGYPGEKIDGSMWTSGQCEDWQYTCGSKTIKHKCDTTGGMSGSAILDGDNNIVGVHTMGTSVTTGTNAWNGGKAITSADLGALQNVAATF